MSETIIAKIIAKKIGREVEEGEIVELEPDILMTHENAGAIFKKFESIGINEVWNKEKIVIPIDHCVPAANEKYAANHKLIRKFVKKYGIKNFYDIKAGICHQVLPEKGHIAPGEIILGADSHSTTYGAFNAFSTGIGRSEAASLMAIGKIWLKVPETFKIEIIGEMPEKTTPKDVILYLIGEIGADGATYKSVEYVGKVVEKMGISGRMTLANMTVEMGGKAGIFLFDEKTKDWLDKRVSRKYEPVEPGNADYEKELVFDVGNLPPQIAAPHTVDNVHPVEDLEGIPIDQVVLGTCTNGRVEDFELAMKILNGKKIDDSVRMLVIPASREIYIEAIERGLITTFAKAGAIVLNPNCGPCLGAHEGVLAPGEKCLSTANRNFKGRMGCKEAEIYLASPATAAATAIKGEITDPRSL